jgi:hypothetical protein
MILLNVSNYLPVDIMVKQLGRLESSAVQLKEEKILLYMKSVIKSFSFVQNWHQIWLYHYL